MTRLAATCLMCALTSMGIAPNLGCAPATIGNQLTSSPREHDRRSVEQKKENRPSPRPCEATTRRLPYVTVVGTNEDAWWLSRQLASYSDSILSLCAEKHTDNGDEDEEGQYSVAVNSRAYKDPVTDEWMRPPGWERELERIRKLKDGVTDNRKRQHYADVLYLTYSKQEVWIKLSWFADETSAGWRKARKSRNRRGWETCVGQLHLFSRKSGDAYDVDWSAEKGRPLRAYIASCPECYTVPNSQCSGVEAHLVDIDDLKVVLEELDKAVDARWKLGAYGNSKDATELKRAVSEFVRLHTFLHLIVHETAELFSALTLEYKYPGKNGFARCHWDAERYAAHVTRLGVLREVREATAPKDPLLSMLCSKKKRGLADVVPVRMVFAGQPAAWSVTLLARSTDFLAKPKPIVEVDLSYFLRPPPP